MWMESHFWYLFKQFFQEPAEIGDLTGDSFRLIFISSEGNARGQLILIS